VFIKRELTINGKIVGCQILTSLNKEINSSVNQEPFIILLMFRLLLYSSASFQIYFTQHLKCWLAVILTTGQSETSRAKNYF